MKICMFRRQNIFPECSLIWEKKTLRFSMDKFIDEFEETMSHYEEPEYFDVSPTYSSVYYIRF